MPHKKRSTALKLFVIVIIALVIFSTIAIIAVYVTGPQPVIAPLATGTQQIDPNQPALIIPGSTGSLVGTGNGSGSLEINADDEVIQGANIQLSLSGDQE